MDLWLEAEVRVRRDALYGLARQAGLIRLAESGRSTGIRGRIADSAYAMSVAFANLADGIRE